jgi:hypothetical protein
MLFFLLGNVCFSIVFFGNWGINGINVSILYITLEE